MTLSAVLAICLLIWFFAVLLNDFVWHLELHAEEREIERKVIQHGDKKIQGVDDPVEREEWINENIRK